MAKKSKTQACIARGQSKSKCKNKAMSRCLTTDGKTKKAKRCRR